MVEANDSENHGFLVVMNLNEYTYGLYSVSLKSASGPEAT